jgi:MFS transporter, FHS family, glucose/mannose:H+ symporter
MKQNTRLRLTLLFTCWTLSLFGSVLATFIMQAIAFFHVSPASAGTLESYQNLTLVVITFIAFSYILKVGYRKALMTVIALMVFLSLITPFIDTYWMIKVYLVGVGITLVGMKVGIYAAVSLVTENESQHAAFLSLAEAMWMLSSMVGMWIIAFFIKIAPDHWIYALWVYSGFGIINFIIWMFTPMDESAIEHEKQQPLKEQIKDIINICKSKIVLAAIIIFFIDQFLENGLTAWMAGFYQLAVNISQSLSVELASFTIFAYFLGRVTVIFLLKYMRWDKVLFVYYIIATAILVYALYTIRAPGHTITSIWNVPVAALILPVVGFFLAPNTPILNSAILSRTVKGKQALLMTVMTITYAISSSISARLTGDLMGHFGGIAGFKLTTLIPIAILIIFILPFGNFLRKRRIE